LLFAGDLTEGYYVRLRVVFVVKSGVDIAIPVASWRRSGQHYRVTLSDAGDECDCPDFYWRHINRGDDNHRCKHIVAARQLLVEGVPAAGTPGRRAGRARPLESAAAPSN
jgi:hypothetical protein